MMVENFEFKKVEGGYALTQYKKATEEEVCVAIPNSYQGEPVVEIGEKAFYYGGTLKQITIPNSVKKIGDYSFQSCQELEEISIPDSVTEMGKGVFCDCRTMTSLDLPVGIKEIPEGFCEACFALETVVIPDGVNKICQSAFSACSNLRSVEFPKSLEIIEKEAFARCYALKQLHLPEGVKTLGASCFVSCVKLEEIDYQGQAIVCEESMFQHCKNIQKAPLAWMEYLELIPQNWMGMEFFKEFKQRSKEEQKMVLTHVKKSLALQQFLFTLPVSEIVNLLLEHEIYPSLKEVDGYLAQSNENESAETKEILSHYKETHFSQAEKDAHEEKLKSSSIPTLEELGQQWEISQDATCITGYKGWMKSAQIPARFGEGGNIAKVQRGEKYNYYSLEHIVVERGITSIGAHCFADHSSLKNVVLPDTLLKLEDSCFVNCVNLKEIRIPSSVEQIGVVAFAHCHSLERVIFLGKEPKMDKDAFVGCVNLQFVGEENGTNLLDTMKI